MWKQVILLLLLSAGAYHYFKSQKETKLPQLTDEYWGPGKPDDVDKSIRPFKIDVSKEVIEDLKARLNRTRSLRQPLEGSSWTYGISSKYLQSVLEHWRTKYDWTKRQALLNKYPQFKTKIQGLDIHFYRVKPTIPKDRSVRILPLLLVHGWPGSVVEFQKIFPLLTTPQPGKDFVFEVIAPSIPGYGFSDAAVRPGLGGAQAAVVLKNLMLRLGFEKFYMQGGDWGSIIITNLAILFPNHVIGVHNNMCFSNTPWNTFLSVVGAYFPSLVISDEHHSKMYPLSHHWSRLVEETGYMHIQATKPDTVGTALTDSPAGLAAYILEKFSTWTNPEYRFREDGGLLEKFSIDELLDNLMVYWVTNSITTSMRFYAENFNKAQNALGLSANESLDKLMVYWVTNSITTSMRFYAENFNKAQNALGLSATPVLPPSACALFPHEIAYQSESLLRSRYVNMVQINHLPRGGHFAAFEEPKLLADDFWTFVSATEAKLKAEKSVKKEL